MLKRILLVFAVLAGLGAVTLGSMAAGYFSHRDQIQPVFGLAERAIVKLRRELGFPTETHAMVDRIDTIYLTLRGKVYLMPDQMFRNGGGLTVWDDQIIVQHARGGILLFDEADGLIKTDLEVPENGREGYIELAATKYPDQFAKEEGIRYNDLEFIDSAVFRGFLVSYTFIDVENECYRTRISKLDIPDSVTSIRDLTATADDWELLYQTNPCQPFNEPVS